MRKKIQNVLWYGVNFVHQVMVFLFCQMVGLFSNPKKFFAKGPINWRKGGERMSFRAETEALNYETRRWLYLLSLPVLWVLVIWVVIKKAVSKVIGVRPKIHVFWFDGVSYIYYTFFVLHYIDTILLPYHPHWWS